MAKSKILVIGVTGNLGFELANASLSASYPTFGLVRDSAFSDPDKVRKIRFLSDAGLQIFKACFLNSKFLYFVFFFLEMFASDYFFLCSRDLIVLLLGFIAR